MNLLTIAAFLIAGSVFGWSIMNAGNDPTAFLDLHGFMVVMGGTISSTAIAFQLDRIAKLFKIFFDRMVRGKKANYRDTIQELMNLAEAYRTKPDKVRELVTASPDPFLREAMGILLDGLFEEEHLEHILHTRVETLYTRYSADAKMFQSMGKFPPAMGLMGAVLGMIALLGSLGRPGAEASIGPAMSVALVATFYGIALANIVVIPIAENLNEGAKELKIKNSIIVEGVFLIAKKTNPILLAEELNSYLLPGERIDVKTAVNANTNAAAGTKKAA